MSSRKRVVILGSTGSIGESALKVARDLPDRMEVVGLAAGRSAQALLAQAAEFKPRAVALYDTTELDTIRGQLPAGTACHGGPEGLIELATLPEADMVLISIVGTAGLAPALAAIRAGKDIAVASKEILVMAGEEVTREAAKHKVAILPVDSEHNAIFQCLVGEPSRHIRRLILTASGGPVPQDARGRPREGHARPGAQASDVEHGPQDHDRFRHALQQGPGDDRGALAFRRADGAGRCRRASAKHRPFAGGIRRWLAARAAQPFRHVLSRSSTR